MKALRHLAALWEAVEHLTPSFTIATMKYMDWVEKSSRVHTVNVIQTVLRCSPGVIAAIIIGTTPTLVMSMDRPGDGNTARMESPNLRLAPDDGTTGTLQHQLDGDYL